MLIFIDLIRGKQKKAKQLLGELPKEVDQESEDYDKDYVKPFLKQTDQLINKCGKERVRERATILNSQCEYVKTLLQEMLTLNR